MSSGGIPFDAEAVLQPGPEAPKIDIGSDFSGAPVNSAKQGNDVLPGFDISGALPMTLLGTTEFMAGDYANGCGSVDGANDVVYEFTAAGPVLGAPQYINFDLCASGYDTKIWIEDAGGTVVACNDDACPGYRSYLAAVELTDGEVYNIFISGWSPGDFGAYTLEMTAAPDPYDCIAGDTPEGEACGTHTNDLNPNAGSISMGETVCGTSYAEGGVRDNDYFTYVIPAGDGEVLTITAQADFASSWYIMFMNEAATTYYALEFGSGGIAQITDFWVPTGTWQIYITMNLAAADRYGYDCGTNAIDVNNGNYRYRLSVDGYAPIPVDNCELAMPLTEGVNAFDLAGLTADGQGVGWGINGWYSFTPPAGQSGIVEFEVCTDPAYDLPMQYIPDPDPPYEPIPVGADDLFVIQLWNACHGDGLGFDYNGGWVPFVCAVDGPMYVSGPVLDGESVTLEILSLLDFYEYAGTITVTFTELEAFNDLCGNAQDMGEGDMAGWEFIHNFASLTDGTYYPNYGTTVSNTRCDDVGLNFNGLGADVWFTWTADVTGWAIVSTCADPGWDGKLEIFEGTQCYDDRLPIACGDDDCEREGAGVMPEVEFACVDGQSYLIRLGGWYAPPDYPDASQGTGYMWIGNQAGIWIPRPANDACADATNNVLVAGVSDTRLGTLDDASNHDCLLVPPTVWEAFTLVDCQDVDVSYCGTTQENYWVADENIVTACPCYDGLILTRDARAWNLCADFYYLKTMTFNSLTPGSYYLPITPGFEECPEVGVPGCDYSMVITGASITCDYCAGDGSPLACPASGATHIQDVMIGDLANMGTGCDGYMDYTAMAANLYEGFDYELTVIVGKQGSIVNANDEVWAYIDWLQDYSFFQLGDYYGLSRQGQTFTTMISPAFGSLGPGEGPSGSTLMRIRVGVVSEGAIQSCGSTTWGEVEDYTLNIIELPCVTDVATIVDLYTNPLSTPPEFWAVADCNGDCTFDLSDVICVVEAANGGPAPTCFPCIP